MVKKYAIFYSMSQKNLKRKRQLQKIINQITERHALDIALEDYKKLNKNFDDLSKPEKLQLVFSARNKAIKDLNMVLEKK